VRRRQAGGGRGQGSCVCRGAGGGTGGAGGAGGRGQGGRRGRGAPAGADLRAAAGQDQRHREGAAGAGRDRLRGAGPRQVPGARRGYRAEEKGGGQESGATPWRIAGRAKSLEPAAAAASGYVTGTLTVRLDPASALARQGPCPGGAPPWLRWRGYLGGGLRLRWRPWGLLVITFFL